jgi:hypothetical protein
MFYYPLKLVYFHYVMLIIRIKFYPVFAPPDDFKLSLLTLELEYAKARANRNDEVGCVGILDDIFFDF